MSEYLFQRKYKLIIGRPQETTEENIIEANTKNFKTNQLTDAGVRSKIYEDTSFIEITDLDLKGNIKYSKTSDARNGDSFTLVLRGLTEATKDFIRQGDILLLSAGYIQDQQLPLVLSGEIVTKTQQTPVAGDELKLTVAQSFTAFRNIRVSKSWPPEDANLYKVLKDLVDLCIKSGIDFGSSEGLEEIRPVLETIKFVGGYSVEGNMFAVLDKILSTYGGRCYFALDVMYIESKNFPITTEIYVLESENLKAPPIITQKSIKKKRKEKKNYQTGYEFTVHLDGRIKLGSKLRVPSGPFQGEYQITAIEHQLDYEGSSWTTRILCQREDT